MKSFADTLRELIALEGPITVERYMDLCLQHYYATRDPLGAGGDFTTAPEISQMFGELIGLWMLEAWSAMGRPRVCRLVELGPGRGTLMA
ncbi:MAG TPA: SAM-dependent methyltransferase, partial [Rubellimicrobium sp.]|nr:SAM-dependent methyltransferase [Rubellimicrobium sp.]